MRLSSKSLPLAAIFSLAPISAAFAEDSFWGDIVTYIRREQQSLHQQLAEALQKVADGGEYALIGLLGLSFMYGVFHAAGPGHGKAVIGTYIVSQRSHLKQGVLLSVAAALMQGFVAILLVQVLSLISSFATWALRDVVPMMETASFVLVSFIGVFLIWRAMKMWRQVFAKPAVHAHNHHDHHHNGHKHEIDEATGHCNHCGGTHMVTPNQAANTNTLREQLAVIFSIGIRPCSGSVIVLAFAAIFSLHWIGIGAVIAISLGTAVTVSALAVFAVLARDAASGVAKIFDHPLLIHGPAALSLAGGIVILLLGVSLTISSFGTAHPLL